MNEAKSPLRKDRTHHGRRAEIISAVAFAGWIQTVFLVAVEDLVAGLARDAELPAHIAHAFARWRRVRQAFAVLGAAISHIYISHGRLFGPGWYMAACLFLQNRPKEARIVAIRA